MAAGDCGCRTRPAPLDPLALALELTAFELQLTDCSALEGEVAQSVAGGGGGAHDATAEAQVRAASGRVREGSAVVPTNPLPHTGTQNPP